jgi:hypothetical protein
MRWIAAMVVMLGSSRLWLSVSWAETGAGARVAGAYFSQPPVLDGDLSDPCWQQAEPITDLKESSTGGAPKELTTFRLGHDDRYLCWSVHAKDSARPAGSSPRAPAIHPPGASTLRRRMVCGRQEGAVAPPADVWTLSAALVQPRETPPHSVASGHHCGTSTHGPSPVLVQTAEDARRQADRSG